MLVQRKWMYLESIFVGSDDIRHQLPQVRPGRPLELGRNLYNMSTCNVYLLHLCIGPAQVLVLIHFDAILSKRSHLSRSYLPFVFDGVGSQAL